MYNNVDDLRAPLQNAFVFVFLSFHINFLALESHSVRLSFRLSRALFIYLSGSLELTRTY